MIPSQISPYANHVWQSTWVAGLALLVAFALRRNRAHTRHWIWMAASLKFLVPFSLLIGIGGRFEWRSAPALPPAFEQIGRPFSLPPMPAVAATVPAPGFPWASLLAAVWFIGCAGVVSIWFVRWRRVRWSVRAATPLPILAPIEVRSSRERMEPGVFGVFRPVLLLPEGIAECLTPAQLHAILAHEFCHVRRRDNLAAAIHMVVEALFWFHPLVWWIGARLVEERERACDEEVLRQGSEPEVYAAGILNVCKFYLESPLACASGVTGADLKKRIEAIMTKRNLAGLTFARKLLLAAAGIAAVTAPMAIGVLRAAQASDRLRFEVASIKPADPNSRGMRFTSTPGNGLSAIGVTLRTLIEVAYDVRSFQISGGPGWVETERYEILAKPEVPEGPDDQSQATKAQQKELAAHLRERIRTLMADRFSLAVHRETKDLPVYNLVVAKGGYKLEKSDEPGGITRNRGKITGKKAPIGALATVLSFVLGRPVVDQTGLTEDYAFNLEWAEEFDAVRVMKEKNIPVPLDTSTPETVPADPAGPSIFTAIEKQLGLKLESTKGPVEIIVIDGAEKPTAN